uniref:Uncharacterized protein n=1 Tax=Rhizophora mucronata TaxID=61149 RepID=A0A2P2Q467_RHIMU
MKQFPSVEEENSARLFGVAIGFKRGRDGEGAAATAAAEEKSTLLQLHQPRADAVKAEPPDCPNGASNGDNQDTQWLKQALKG